MGKNGFRKLQAKLVFYDEPSDQTPAVDASRTHEHPPEITKVDVPRTFEGGAKEPGQKVVFGNTAYGPIRADLQFANNPQPAPVFAGQRPFNGYQQPPINYAQGSYPQHAQGSYPQHAQGSYSQHVQGSYPQHAQGSYPQPAWTQGGNWQGGMPQQGGYYQQQPMAVPQYGRPAVHWPQGQPFTGGMPVYGGGGFRVTAGGQPMMHQGAFSQPPTWNGQYQVFNSRTPQAAGYPIPGSQSGAPYGSYQTGFQGGYPNSAQPGFHGGYPNGHHQTGMHVPGSAGNSPTIQNMPNEDETSAALSRGGTAPPDDNILSPPDESTKYFDASGRPVEEPAGPAEGSNPPSPSGQGVSSPGNRPTPPAGHYNPVYQPPRQPHPGYRVGPCTGGACSQPAMQQGFGQPFMGANTGPCLNEGCGMPGGMPQMPCLNGDCGMPGGMPQTPCLNGDCGMPGGMPQTPCVNGDCGIPGGMPQTPCLNDGCGMPGGMPQIPFPGSPLCMGGDCGVGGVVSGSPFRMAEPCLNEGCGTGGGFVQQPAPCMGTGCTQPGGFPPQAFGGGAPMMPQARCPPGHMWMVANTGYG